MTRYQQLCSSLPASPKRWLVTGAAGFIGSALVETLLRLDQTVVGLDNFITGHRHNIDDLLASCTDAQARRFSFIEGDIRHRATCIKACTSADFVLHQAALGSVPRSIEEPLETHSCNVNGFLEMITAARDTGVHRMVYASSSSVYGDDPRMPKMEAHIGTPLSPYAVSKRIDEMYAEIFQSTYDLQSIGLRYFNVFGRRQDPNGAYAAVIPKWIALLLKGDPCRIFGDGQQSRDFCYIDNVVQANLLAATVDQDAQPPVSTHVYNVGCNGRTTLNELFCELRDALATINPEVSNAECVHTSPRAGDIMHSQANMDSITTALGYDYSHDLGQGLLETVSWFAAHADRT